MADAPPPPVAIRITRPYESEDEYLAQELEMISKTSITLVGAQPRPQGVVLRFELVLAGGAVLVRGEGRVVGFKANAHRGVGGLTLRFTRIDARSKALLDKATAMREQRRPSSKPPKDAVPPEPEEHASPRPAAGSPPPPPVAAPPPLPPPPPPAEETPVPAVLAPPRPSPPPLPPPPVAAAPQSVPERSAPPPLPAAPASNGAASDLPRAERDSLLERLRTRGKNLDPDRVREILEQRKRGTL